MALKTDMTDMNLFDLAEKAMFDDVKAKVRNRLINEQVEAFREMITKEVEERLVEYSSSGIQAIENHMEMRREYEIWLRRGDSGEREKVGGSK